MEAQQRAQQLRTPMDPLVSLAANFFSALSAPPQPGSTFRLLPLPVAAARALSVLRRLLLLATQAFISIFIMFLSAPAPVPPPQPPALAPTLPRAEPGSPEGQTCVGRSLAHVLSMASRKNELVRGLAERLLDDNVSAGDARVGAVNCATLARVRSDAAAAGGRGGRGVTRDGAGGADGDAVVEADGRFLAGRGVRGGRGRQAGRRAALAQAEDGRVQRGP